MAKEFQVTYDCADPGAQARFWAHALGYRVQPPPEGFSDWAAALTARGVPPEHHNDRSAITDPDGRGPRVYFQKVPEGKTVKNRLHLDVRAAPGLTGDVRMAALEEEATRLEALGAKRLTRLEANGVDEGIIVMTDPEGNEFCLD
ncbi:VOC family protein [Streptomyces albidochromogenes]|uniref:VOC family protein n=1 Tax=Streptomyces albidochromogenes TaxID=329524 RepID=A0ABW6FCT5_9ACTN